MSAPHSKSWGHRVLTPHEVHQLFGEEPKACPFCESRTVGLWLGPSPHMTCGSCGADGPVFEGPRETLQARQHAAIKAWQAAKRPTESTS